MGNITETQSLSDYVAAQGITCEIIRDRGAQVQDGWEHHAYTVKLTNPATGATIETPWKQGYGIETSPTDTPAEVLDSLLADAWGFTEDFEEWASEYGYDSDSRKAYQIWEQVRDQRPAVVAFLGGESAFEDVATNYERL